MDVFASDYLSYSDSTSTLSEAGLTVDAHTAWDWLCTAVALQFVRTLEAEQGGKEEGGHERLRGVVLLALFSPS